MPRGTGEAEIHPQTRDSTGTSSEVVSSLLGGRMMPQPGSALHPGDRSARIPTTRRGGAGPGEISSSILLVSQCGEHRGAILLGRGGDLPKAVAMEDLPRSGLVQRGLFPPSRWQGTIDCMHPEIRRKDVQKRHANITGHCSCRRVPARTFSGQVEHAASRSFPAPAAAFSVLHAPVRRSYANSLRSTPARPCRPGSPGDGPPPNNGCTPQRSADVPFAQRPQAMRGIERGRRCRHPPQDTSSSSVSKSTISKNVPKFAVTSRRPQPLRVPCADAGKTTPRENCFMLHRR
jgi:hypothetical protein